MVIGEHTLLLTKKGFRYLKDLKIGDEVATAYGTYRPITRISDRKPADRVLNLSTGENIICDDAMLWNVHHVEYGKKNEFMYPCEIEAAGICEFDHINELKRVKNTVFFNPYEFGSVVPTSIPVDYLLSRVEYRLELFAGLVDSPICERVYHPSLCLYKFYTKYIKLEIGIIMLARSMGWGVECKKIDDLYIITVCVSSYALKLPIKDDLKRPNYDFFCRSTVKIKEVGRLEPNTEFGRNIDVEGGCFLVGYSLIPAK